MSIGIDHRNSVVNRPLATEHMVLARHEGAARYTCIVLFAVHVHVTIASDCLVGGLRLGGKDGIQG